MYHVVFATRAKKDLRKHDRSGSFPLAKFERAIDTLAEGRPLQPAFQDHALKGSLSDQSEFHLAYDLLVQYKRSDVAKTLTVMRIGTHDELFAR